jgi:hypothetical protein
MKEIKSILKTKESNLFETLKDRWNIFWARVLTTMFFLLGNGCQLCGKTLGRTGRLLALCALHHSKKGSSRSNR